MAVPSAPDPISPIPSNAQVFLNWIAPSNGGSAITDYIIQYSTNGVSWSTFADGTSTNSYTTITGLTNDQTYLFRVAAINVDGTGSYSPIVNSTPYYGDIPEYCQPSDLADWLGVDINANTDPNTKMIKSWISMNETRIDTLTGHSWKNNKVYSTETFDISEIYDWGWGMYLPLKHRNIKSFDADLGDKFEIWNGSDWVEQTITDDINSLIDIEPTKGVVYVRGFIYTILRKNRIRFTYRYGGTKEGSDVIPKDIKKACILMTAIDLLSRDFKYSQIAYGGDGQIKKESIIDKWQKEINNIIWCHSEIITVF